MKKLMIAAAIVCAAAISQAAVATWNISAANIFNGTGSTAAADKYSGTAYLFDAGVMSQSSLFALIAEGTAIGSSTDGYAGTLNVNTAAIGLTAINYGEQSTADASNSYSFYLVVVDDDKAYFSQTLTKTANKSSTAVAMPFASQNNGTSTFSAIAPAGDGFQGAGRWSAVPEPTSGLLLLLGVAGLALKRRRA